MRSLTDRSFKFPVNVYWVTSRESDNMCWTAVLAPNSDAVIEYKARARRGNGVPHDLKWIADLNDINDHWLGLWRRKAFEANTRGTHCAAGVAFPSSMSEELIDTWVTVRGTWQRACTRSAQKHTTTKASWRSLVG